MSFDPVPVVKVGGDREPVAMNPGRSVRDMFDLATYLQIARIIESGPGQKAKVTSHPIRFAYEDTHGRRHINEEYEIGFVDVTDARLIVRKRPAKRPRTFRGRVGALLLRLATRLLRCG